MLPEKECEICGILFQPTRANQKYCPDCRKHPEQKKKEYSRALARSIREYGTGYEAPVFFESACKYCGHVFQNNRFQLKKFCSDVCEHNWILEHTRCVNCGKPATEGDNLPKHDSDLWYCSERCRHEAWMKDQREQGNTHPCPVCGKEVYNSKTYCSQECYEKARPKAKTYAYICLYCGKQGISNSPKKFCSKECYRAAVKSGWKPANDIPAQRAHEKQKNILSKRAVEKKKGKKGKIHSGKWTLWDLPHILCRLHSNDIELSLYARGRQVTRWKESALLPYFYR